MKRIKTPLIDLHTDFILGEANFGKKIFDIDTSKQINKHLAQKGDIKLLFAGFSYDDEKGCTEIMLSEMEKFVRESKNKFKVIFHLEGAEILAGNHNLLKKLYDRGIRSVGLAHIHDNSLCGSSSGVSKKGLTEIGRRIIHESLKLEIIIDLAHMSSKAVSETLKIIGKPPIISHTACYSIEPNPRNIKDSQIKKIAKMKGVIGIFFSGKYINSQNTPTIKDVANHIDHLVKIGGINCAAIGSDFGGITTGTPIRLESIDKLKNLFSELRNRGYSENYIEKIAYKNAQGVIRAWNPSLLSQLL